MRRAGRGQIHEYFYIGHYIPSTKKKDWCQIKGIKNGFKEGLADIAFMDPRYPQYKVVLEIITRYFWEHHSLRSMVYDAEELNLISIGCQMLHEFGWPARWAYAKFVEDWKMMSAILQSRQRSPTNELDKEKRRLRKEYRKTIPDKIRILASTGSNLLPKG